MGRLIVLYYRALLSPRVSLLNVGEQEVDDASEKLNHRQRKYLNKRCIFHSMQ